MAGVWNTAILDIVVPSTGTLTPGSGTMYIGGPRLPTALTDAGVDNALVWYTDDNGYLAGYDFWFLGHTPFVDLSDPEALVIGYKETASPDIVKVWSSNIYEDAQYLQNVWQGETYLTEIDGIPNCEVAINWKWTADSVVEVRYFIECPSPPGLGLDFFDVTLPSNFPEADLAPDTNRGPYLTCTGESINFTSMMARVNPIGGIHPFGGTMSIFCFTNVNNNYIFEGGGSFIVRKQG